jgi:hypothetical protein
MVRATSHHQRQPRHRSRPQRHQAQRLRPRRRTVICWLTFRIPTVRPARPLPEPPPRLLPAHPQERAQEKESSTLRRQPHRLHPRVAVS